MKEGLFWTRDGERLYYRFQEAKSNQKLLLLIHGHGEHSGRYLKFFEQLKGLEQPIAAFDLRGCGRSSGHPVFVSNFEEYLSDVTDLVKFLRDRYRVTGPLDLFGHSLGGLIATLWAGQNQFEISKLILSSPFFGMHFPGLTGGVAAVLNRWFPRWALQNVVRPPSLTHDLNEVEKYRSDPLIQHKITVRLAYEMYQRTLRFQRQIMRFSFPVFILMAGDDRVVDSKATRQFFSRLQAPEKDLTEFPGFYHEIFNEVEQSRVFERLRYYLHR